MNRCVARWACVALLALPGVTSADSLGYWVGHIDHSSVPSPSVLGRIVKFISGGEPNRSYELPFDVLCADQHVLTLCRRTNDVTVLNRRTGKIRRIEFGEAGLVSPVAVSGTVERFFISDPGQSAILVYADGDLHTFVDSSSGLIRPTGLAWDSVRNRLWVADTERHELLCYSRDGELQQTLGARGEGENGFNYPTFIALDADGSIIVNDSMNGAIKKFDAEGRLVWVVGSLGASSPVFARAKGIALDGHNRVFVVDNLNDCVVVIGADGNVLGSLGTAGSGPGEMWCPVGAAVCGDTLIVADTQNDRLTLFAIGGGAR